MSGIPHLVEVWEKYAPDGLVMLALSDESSSTIESFMEGKKMPYPIGSGSQSGQAFGISGYPSAYLIGWDGTVLWEGHPSGGEWVAMLPDAMKAAAAMADEWDPGERIPELEKAVELCREGELSKVWRETDMLLKRHAEEPEIAKNIEAFRKDFLARADGRTQYAETMTAEGRYFEASEFLDHQVDLFKGTPTADQWEATMKEWKKDRAIKEMLSLDKKRVQALEKAWEGDKEKALKDLGKVLEDAKGTPLEPAVRKSLDSLRG